MNQPESIVLAFSNVLNDNLKHLNPELQKIRNVLKDAEQENRINIIEHNGVTYNSLSFLLNSAKGKDVTMLHYSGHSTRNGLLVQSNDESGIVSKKPLSNLVKTHKKFRFIFLNSCYSREIAQELVNAGVPYVIGTSDKVKDGAAALVAAKFYSLLAKSGKTIEDAFLLTKDYIEDPMNNDDGDQREAFRTFDLFDEATSNYPWQLYQCAEIANKDKNWVLTHAKKTQWIKYAAGLAGIALVALLILSRNWMFGNGSTKTYKNSDTSILINPPSNTDKKADSLLSKKNPEKNKTDPPEHEQPIIKPVKPQYQKVGDSSPKVKAADLEIFDRTSYEQLASTDMLSFVVSKDKLSFTGKLDGYNVQGKLSATSPMHFNVSEGNISGEVSFTNNGDKLIGSIMIKDSQVPHPIDMERKSD